MRDTGMTFRRTILSAKMVCLSSTDERYATLHLDVSRKHAYESYSNPDNDDLYFTATFVHMVG